MGQIIEDGQAAARYGGSCFFSKAKWNDFIQTSVDHLHGKS